MSEYQYLLDVIYCRYEAEYRNLVTKISQLHGEAVRGGDYDRATLLKAKYLVLQEKLIEECLRLESIVNWLEADNNLRKIGLTYPDTFENDRAD